ncbi:restriction endonuclease subunit S [Trichococcus ilyis]|uniref:Restriction endonuclease type i hsds n=1 Tax=Trichococcus ilyis TaxID=640938 RepID=A0A143YX91_9LACT|nr:restriction endonuclease subunit S [Trichococcus ilyis]CZQ99762.1 restriction endonuclease type i hsds [Trichococcus ilyis]SEJ72412.1 type I restriction enzyme, S subunit [Trichococcus ilyis]
MVRAMKDSGVEWIGEIPEHWDIKKIKYLLKERNEKNTPIKTRDILSLSAANGVVPYGEKTGGGNKAKDDVSLYKIAHPKDIVMNSMNIIAGSVALSQYHGCVSPVYYMFYSDDKDSDINYFSNIFQSKEFQRSLMGLGNGILIKHSEKSDKLNTIRLRIPSEKMKNTLLPVPPLKEQRKIAAMLDEKNAHIDSIISKTKESIEAFKTYKQALITETVTKGLNPDVKMKDSGIEWIGEIPEHWEITKIKNIVKIVNGKDNVVKDGEIPVYGSSATPFGFTDKIMHDKETVLLGRKGTIDKPQFIKEPFWAVDTVFYTIPKRNTYLKFFFYCMSGFDYKKYTYGSAIPSMSQGILNEIKLPYPILKEQQQIADFLDEKTAHIDSLIANKEKMVQELEAYKKAMIYEYVTGKKEVE